MCPQEPISQRKRILLSWSSGKDSAWCLQVLRKNRDYEIVGLLTTFNEAANRVAMHAVRRELVERQAFAASLPLWPVHLPWPCANEKYEELMAGACEKAINDGIEGIAFGDLFLEDVRAYRDLRAKLTCIDTSQLDAEFLGREFDEELFAALPADVDPCGEKGEFHSFVYAGPMFDLEIPVVVGETVVRDQFVFADLTPASSRAWPSFPKA
jgi:diphthamide synthase (EF-2-diphthine--ammonia ligase)